MNIIELVFTDPALRDEPPVLVDLGAAGGLPRVWRSIARHCIVVAFEPDARESAEIEHDRQKFRRWILCPALAVPYKTTDGKAVLHLTGSPQCSSMLRPRADQLAEWAFADFFLVNESRALPCLTIDEALHSKGIDRIDWLKCDTQGLDLSLFRSLPSKWRERVLVAEFEPGLIDAYDGEDKASSVLAAMAKEPFWLSEFRVGRTVRGRQVMLRACLGERGMRWARRCAPGAPGWANLRFIRDLAQATDVLTRREYLLGWIFALVAKQPAYALFIALEGERRFGDALFAAMVRYSRRCLRWAIVSGAPSWLLRRLFRSS